MPALAVAACLGAPGATGALAAQERAEGGGAEQRVVRLGLDEAVRRAVTLHEDVLVARAEQARMQGLEREVRARSLPDLSADFGYTRNVQRPVLFFNTSEGVQQISIGEDNEYAFGLSLTQPLLDFSLGPARRAAGLNRRSTAARVEAARTRVSVETKLVYFTVLLDRELVLVQEKALEQAEARLAEVERMHRAGTAAEFDLLTAQVEVENIRPQLIEARNRLALDRQRLKRAVSLPLDVRLELTDLLARPAAPVAEDAEARALAQRSDLEAQRLSVELWRQNLAAQRGAAWPSFDLVAAFSRRASSADFLPSEPDFVQTATAGLQVSLPLLDGRARSGRVQQAEAAVDRERYLLQRLADDVRLEVRQARQALEAARQRVAASESNVGRAERALDIAHARFRNGLSTQVELNDAELAATRARTNLAQALYDYNATLARLEAAMGER